MILVAALFGFVLAFLGSIPPTGPIALLVFQKGLSKKFAEGRALALGAAIPEAVYSAMAVFGLSAIFARFPGLEVAVRAVGIVVLSVLGAYFLRYRADVGSAHGEVDASPRDLRRAFWLGFSVAAANPVLMVTWSASFALVYAMSHLRIEGLARLSFALGVAGGVMAWFGLVLALLERKAEQVTERFATRTIQGAGVAILLAAVAFGVSMVRKSLVGS